MAVDLGVSNSIINSFAQGRSEALQRQKLAEDKKQQEIENKAKADAAAESTRQFNESFRQQGDQLKASQAMATAQFNLSKALALPQFQKLAEESGTVPGFSVGPSADGSTMRTFTGTGAGTEGMSFNAATPEEAARRTAERERIMLKPKTEAEIEQDVAGYQAKAELEEAKNNFEAQQRKLDRESREKVAELNRKARLEAATISGKNTQSVTKASQFSQQFNTNDIVKRYAANKETNDYVQSVTGATGVSDYSLLVAYAKATDPDSAVKEGEVKAAQTAAQTLSDQFKFKLGRINKLVPFLSPEARVEIKKEVKSRFDASEKNYKNFRKETEKKFGEIGVDPSGWLVDYTGAAVEPETPGKNEEITFEELQRRAKGKK